MGKVVAEGKANANNSRENDKNKFPSLADLTLGERPFGDQETDASTSQISSTIGSFCAQSWATTTNNIALKATAYVSIHQHVNACIRSIKQVGFTNNIQIKMFTVSYVTSGVSVGVSTTITSLDKQDITSTLSALSSNSDVKKSGATMATAVLILIIIVVVIVLAVVGGIVGKMKGKKT